MFWQPCSRFLCAPALPVTADADATSSTEDVLPVDETHESVGDEVVPETSAPEPAADEETEEDAETVTDTDISDALDGVQEILDTSSTYTLDQLMQSATPLVLGEPAEAYGVATFTLQTVFLADQIVPSSPDTSYSYIDGNTGYNYLVV